MMEDMPTATVIDQPSSPTQTIGTKRSRTPDSEPESKRPRLEPDEIPTETVRNSENPIVESNTPDAPVTTEDVSANDLDKQKEVAEVKPKSSELHRKIDEGKRAKRLFGALLNLNQRPDERKVKQRREIESRKKAELQQQDDRQTEDDQRRLEQLVERRRETQEEVDRDYMRIRHRNMIHTAHFLQTRAQPRLYYLPWTLRPDEEDQIDDQIAEARAIVDRERKKHRRHSSESRHDNDVDSREERFVEQSLKAAGSSTKRTPTPDVEEAIQQQRDAKDTIENDKEASDDDEMEALRPSVNGTAKQEEQDEHRLENEADGKTTQANGSADASDTGQSQLREAVKTDEPQQEEADMDDGDADEDAVIY